MLEALRSAEAAGEVVVVAGAHPVPCDNLSQAPVRFVECADWQLGPGASLRAGLAVLPDQATHALVVLADGPDLDPRAVDRVAGQRHEADVVAATYDGAARSHPLAVARPVWGSIPDAGLRALPVHLVDCSDLRPPGDVDTRR